MCYKSRKYSMKGSKHYRKRKIHILLHRSVHTLSFKGPYIFNKNE